MTTNPDGTVTMGREEMQDILSCAVHAGIVHRGYGYTPEACVACTSLIIPDAACQAIARELLRRAEEG